MKLLQGKVALVTGGAGGIGSAICTALAREGAVVVVGYNKSADAAQSLVEKLEKSDQPHVSLRVPVTETKALNELSVQLEALYGRCDILVNCHGAVPLPPLGL
jgi:3-oxoacyl-[acyl-carrier protein] reductase